MIFMSETLPRRHSEARVFELWLASILISMQHDRMKASQIIFVYGSLKKGMRAHHLLSNAQFLGHVETKPQYGLVVWEGFPALVDGHRSIEGELYEVPVSHLSVLDEYEGAPEEYIRQPIAIASPITHTKILGYVLNEALVSEAEPIDDTCWLD